MRVQINHSAAMSSIEQVAAIGTENQKKVDGSLKQVHDRCEVDRMSGFVLPTDVQMPTTEEIEQDLALGSAAWRSLLRSARPFIRNKAQEEVEWR